MRLKLRHLSSPKVLIDFMASSSFSQLAWSIFRKKEKIERYCKNRKESLFSKKARKNYYFENLF